jgi:hypothetical protein
MENKKQSKKTVRKNKTVVHTYVYRELIITMFILIMINHKKH